MKQSSLFSHHIRLLCAVFLTCTMLLACGLTVIAAESGAAPQANALTTKATTTTAAATVTVHSDMAVQTVLSDTTTPTTSADAALATAPSSAPVPTNTPTSFDATTSKPSVDTTHTPHTSTATSAQPNTEYLKNELYPVDVLTVIEDGARQIIKTYIITESQNPADISRDSFTLDGWSYALTDITESRSVETDTRSHVETVEINTTTKDMNEIIKLLSPTLEYESEDEYSGILTLDLTSVNCEAAGHKNSSYTVSATREYQNLSTKDLSLIPKSVTDNGRTLELDSVSWAVQQYKNIDFQDIPDSYRAVAKYTAKASRSVATGYITTAEYSGEIAKTVVGDAIYTAYFWGTEIAPTPTPTPFLIQTPNTTVISNGATTSATPTPTASPKNTATPEPITAPSTYEPPTDPAKASSTATSTPDQASGNPLSIALILIGVGAFAAIAGVGAYVFLYSNVKIFRDNFSVLIAKDKISAKNTVINLTTLNSKPENRIFGIEINKYAAKKLNGMTVETVYGSTSLEHKIAYEGNAYRIEANFVSETIQAIY